MTWRYDTSMKRYRNLQTGQTMSSEDVARLVDQSVSASGDIVADLARLAANGQLNRTDFERRMREQIKLDYIRQGVIGRGGRAQMTQADWGSIGGQLSRQYVYLQRFAAELELGGISEGQAVVRAKMYSASSRQAFERLKARAAGADLPQYPGDGRTACMTNCKCHWDIRDVRDDNGNIIGYDCYWTLDEAEHCVDCLRNAREWAPYPIRF